MSSVLLMYHRIGHAEEPGRDAGEALYLVAPEMFRAHIDTLVCDRSSVVGLDRVAQAASGNARLPDRSVCLTFDDGNASDYHEALPVLSRNRLTAAFFVSPALIGSPGYLTWSEVRDLRRAGMTIGAHGLDHRPLHGLTDPELEHQLVESRRILENELREPVWALSLPNGAGSAGVLAKAREAGFRLVAGSEPRRFEPGRDALCLPRIAVRKGSSAAWVRAIAEQRPVALGLMTARYFTLRSIRRVLGERAYRSLRARLSGADART